MSCCVCLLVLLFVAIECVVAALLWRCYCFVSIVSLLSCWCCLCDWTCGWSWHCCCYVVVIWLCRCACFLVGVVLMCLLVGSCFVDVVVAVFVALLCLFYLLCRGCVVLLWLPYLYYPSRVVVLFVLV